MRVPSFQHNREMRFDQAMTPMIDVVFLLLIFFVCASMGKIAESLMTVDLSTGNLNTPEAKPITEEPSFRTEVWIKLKWDQIGNRTIMEMNNRVISSFADLTNDLKSLAKLSADSPIILDIEPQVPAGDVIRVDDACRAAKFQSINYAANPDVLQQKK